MYERSVLASVFLMHDMFLVSFVDILFLRIGAYTLHAIYYITKAVAMAFSVGQRLDDDVPIDDEDDVDNMDADQVAGWSAISAMASPAPKLEVVSNQGR